MEYKVQLYLTVVGWSANNRPKLWGPFSLRCPVRRHVCYVYDFPPLSGDCKSLITSTSVLYFTKLRSQKLPMNLFSTHLAFPAQISGMSVVPALYRFQQNCVKGSGDGGPHAYIFRNFAVRIEYSINGYYNIFSCREQVGLQASPGHLHYHPSFKQQILSQSLISNSTALHIYKSTI